MSPSHRRGSRLRRLAYVVMKKEPYATTMQKLIVGVVKWLPIDSQL